MLRGASQITPKAPPSDDHRRLQPRPVAKPSGSPRLPAITSPRAADASLKPSPRAPPVELPTLAVRAVRDG
eukprot:4342683-Prymnesium_polylepis.1